MTTVIDSYIRRSRANRGRPKVTLPDEIDWGKTLEELALEYGCSYSRMYVEFRRRFNGQRKTFRHTPPKDKASWQRFKTWNWTKNNNQLAREHGYTRERVRQIRRDLGIPKIERD